LEDQSTSYPFNRYLSNLMDKIASYYIDGDDRFIRSVRIFILTIPTTDGIKRRTRESYDSYVKNKQLILESGSSESKKRSNLIKNKSFFFELFFNLYVEAVNDIMYKILLKPYSKVVPTAKTTTVEASPAFLKGKRRAR